MREKFRLVFRMIYFKGQRLKFFSILAGGVNSGGLVSMTSTLEHLLRLVFCVTTTFCSSPSALLECGSFLCCGWVLLELSSLVGAGNFSSRYFYQ